MKRLWLFCLLAAMLIAPSTAHATLTYGASYYQQNRVTFGNADSSDPLYLFMNEVDTGLSSVTLANGATMDNAVNNVIEFNENSEEIKLTFSENALAWSSTSGVVLWDYGTIVPKADQMLFDPVATAVGTVEGTVYYDSDTDKLFVRNASAWVDLTAGASGVTDLDTAYNGGNTIDVDGDAVTLTVSDGDNNVVLALVQNDATNDPAALTVTMGAGSTGTAVSINSVATGTDIAGDNWSVNQAGAMTIVSVAASGAVSAGTSLTAGTGLTVTAGNTSIGDGTGTFALNSTNFDVSTAGALTGVTTLAMSDDLTMANGKGIKSSTTTAQTVSVFGYDNDTGPGYVSALTITNGNTPATVLGNTNGTTAISSSDWAISTAGAMTGIGAITMDGLLTGSLGATITGATINLNATSNFAVNISTGTTNAQVTIGAGTAPFAINSTAFDVSNTGAVSGVTTLALSDDITMANGKAIKGSTTTAETIKLQAYDNDTGPAYVDAVTITNGNTPGISIGGNACTVAIDSTDWDIDATGAMTGIGAITADGLLTASLGATISGATINLNASSNFAVNIGTGTTTGAIGIGGGQTTQLITIGSSIGGATPLVFEGATDNDVETIFAITDPTVADKTVTFQDATGIVVIDVAPIDTDNNGKTVLAAEAIHIQYCTGAGTWVLPEASTVLGKSFTFVVGAAANIVIDPADGVDLIAHTTCVAGDSLLNATLGSSITLTAVSADLYVPTAINGTWTDNN